MEAYRGDQLQRTAPLQARLSNFSGVQWLHSYVASKGHLHTASEYKEGETGYFLPSGALAAGGVAGMMVAERMRSSLGKLLSRYAFPFA